MKKIYNWKSFNENFFKDAYNFIKLVKMLRGWQRKYQPEDYDRVIAQAFELIDGYGLQPGKISPPFTLPNHELETEFIKKFLATAEEHGYEVISRPAVEREGYTTFNFKR